MTSDEKLATAISILRDLVLDEDGGARACDISGYGVCVTHKWLHADETGCPYGRAIAFLKDVDDKDRVKSR